MATAVSSKSFPKHGPFSPSTKTINRTSASQSSHPITLPHIPELYKSIDEVLNSLFADTAPSKPSRFVPPKPEREGPPAHSLKFPTDSQGHGVTKNKAAAYITTRSRTLDAFSGLSQSTKPEDIAPLLEDSWTTDPDITLRIIWNLRSIHEGKSAREPFYRAFAWLYDTHPKTAIANLRYLVDPCVKRTIKNKLATVGTELDTVTDEDSKGQLDSKQEVTLGLPHGYWKDLLNIVLLAALDQLTPVSSLDALHMERAKRKRKHARVARHRTPVQYTPEALAKDKARAAKHIEESLARDKEMAAKAKKARSEKHEAWNILVTRKLKRDKSFRALYVAVVQLFVDALARDIGILRQITEKKTGHEKRVSLSFELSLVGKWAPSIGGSHDRVTCIATPIAELLHARGHLPFPAEQLEQPLKSDVAHQLRSVYTRWILSPLRRFLQIPEIAMSANDWYSVKYSRVPSKAMQINKDHFLKNDEQRFLEYLQAVVEGKEKISGATLLPHELLFKAVKASSTINESTSNKKRKGKKKPHIADEKMAAMQALVIQTQWNSMLERVKESGTLKNTLAVCDVSASMGELNARENSEKPIFPAVALTILLSQLSQPPWSDLFITFSENPLIHSLKPKAGLVATAKEIMSSVSGMNTDFNAIFTRLILPVALKFKIKPENMVERIFVFSDMQFDDSRTKSNRKRPSNWMTEHRIINKEFERAGYRLPELVYWNLAGNLAKPVSKEDTGTALVSGFSPGMLKIFLEQGNPDVEVKNRDKDDSSEKPTNAERKALDPVGTMLMALNKECFAGLLVLD